VRRELGPAAGLWLVLEVDHGFKQRAHELPELEGRGRVAGTIGMLGLDQIRARQQRSVDVALQLQLMPIGQLVSVRHGRLAGVCCSRL